jgi:hypothetical protein
MSDQFILIQTQKNHAVQKKKKSVAVLMNVRWHLMNGKPPKWKNGVKVVVVGGGGGMNPIDLERLPGKRPLKMKAGGSVKSSASKRADGIAKKGKTRGRMV